MRLHHVLLLAAASILASADATSSISEGKLVAAGQSSVPTRRVLRADTKITDDEEERGFKFDLKLPEGLTNFASKIASKFTAQDDQLTQMLKRGDSADEALKAFKLVDDVDNLLTKANLEKFATYVGMVNQANKKAGKPEVTMIEAITKNYGDDVVAKMLFKGKSNDKTETLATSLEAALFNKWILEKKTGEDVFKLLKIKGPLDPNKPIWTQYRAVLKQKKVSGVRM